jgi:hypothetical protein
MDIQSIMLVFSIQLCTVAPLTFSLVQLPPHPPFPVSKYNIYRQCVVWRWCSEGVESCRDHILQEFYTLYLTRFRTNKIARLHPKQKTRRGGGLRQINTCCKFPIQVNFLDDDIIQWAWKVYAAVVEK